MGLIAAFQLLNAPSEFILVLPPSTLGLSSNDMAVPPRVRDVPRDCFMRPHEVLPGPQVPPPRRGDRQRGGLQRMELVLQSPVPEEPAWIPGVPLRRRRLHQIYMGTI
jgi:hypothetical protein